MGYEIILSFVICALTVSFSASNGVESYHERMSMIGIDELDMKTRIAHDGIWSSGHMTMTTGELDYHSMLDDRTIKSTDAMTSIQILNSVIAWVELRGWH